MRMTEQYATAVKPIRRRLIFGLMLLIVLLCLGSGFLTYRGYRNTTQKEYERHLTGIMKYTARQVDVDDLEKCVETGVASAEYQELQTFLDTLVDTLDVLYVYIFIPRNETGIDSAQSIIASNSQEEYAAGTAVSVLNQLSGTDCPEDVAINNMQAFLSDDISFFETDSVWGSQYTGAVPLFDSDGERFALLCADIGTDTIHRIAMRGVLHTIVPITLIGILAGFFFAVWNEKNIARPIKRLEERARDFAAVCDTRRGPSSLNFVDPDIHTGNEIESLSHAVAHMAAAMKTYAEDIQRAEDQTLSMTLLAYRDPLTRVKNATAYEEEKERLERLASRHEARFAFVLVDLNDLKEINDAHGHELGDEYIIGSCRIICDVFCHSSVFRIGGDEFLAVLENRDYDNREALLSLLRATFAEASGNPDAEPWRRYNAASGMAVYTPADTVRDVFKRADQAMYQNKHAMKTRGPLAE